MKRKIVLLGGGSGYFEGVVGEFCVTPELAGFSVVMYDINKKRMNLVRRAAGRIIEKTGAKIKLTTTMDLARALDGADIAISSIGAQGPRAEWHRLDCQVAARFGIIHTTGDTVGPAGLSQGLRTIPIYIEIARAMERSCPDVILLNHSNPMMAICRAIAKYTKIHVIGYCHNVASDVHYFSEVLGVPVDELEVTVVGPNHMNWLLGIRHQGRDVYPELKRRILAGEPKERHIFARDVLRVFGIYPTGGDRHMLEFFPYLRSSRKPEELPYNLKWRVQPRQVERIQGEIVHKPSELELRASGEKEPRIPERISPESMGQQARAIAYGREMIHLVTTPNRGAVTNLPPWAALEMKAVIGSKGARSVHIGEMPAQAARWSLAQIYAHELTVDAAVEGSRDKAIQALGCDPEMTDINEVEAVFDALVEAQGDRLKRFRKRRPRRGKK